MKAETVLALTTTFEGHAQQTDGGIEYWLARDLQHLLGYTEWRNFLAVISKAKTACEISGHAITDHFVDVNKTIQMPKNAEKIVEDFTMMVHCGGSSQPHHNFLHFFAPNFFAKSTPDHAHADHYIQTHPMLTSISLWRDFIRSHAAYI